MYPTSITMEGFGSWTGPATIDFSNLDLVAIVGDNGVGKSTLLDAMLYSLYGYTRAGAVDSWIPSGANHCQVELILQLEGTAQLQVIRQRSLSGRSGLIVSWRSSPTDPWLAQGDGSMSGGQEAIESTLGAAQESLLASAWLRQGDSSRFCEANPAARRQVLAEILSLHWNDLAVRARQAAALSNQQLVSLRQLLDSHLHHANHLDAAVTERQAADLNVTNAEQALDKANLDLNKYHQAKLANAQHQSWEQQLQSAQRLLETATEAAVTAQRVFDDTYRVASTAPLLSSKLEAGRVRGARLERLSDRSEAALIADRQARADAETQIKYLEQRSERLSTATGDLCPTCEQPLDEGKQKRICHDVATTIDSLRVHLASIHKRGLIHNRRHQQLIVAWRAMQTTLAEYEQEAGAANQAALLVDTQMDNAKAAEEKVSSFKDAVRGIVDSEPPSAVSAGTAPFSELERGVSEAQGALNYWTQQRGSAIAALEQAQQAAHSAKETQVQITAVESELDATKLVQTAASPAEIPTRIIESQIPALEDHINHWLGLMSADSMHMNLTTARARSSGKGEPVATLDLIVSYQGQTRPYSTFSGGERLKLDLACRLGISHLLAARNGSPIRFLVIDEGWGALDYNGTEALLQALGSLRDHFNLIVTITHIKEVAQAFPARLEISRGERGSQAKLLFNSE